MRSVTFGSLRRNLTYRELTLQDGGDEYALLVNLKRLHELHLSRYVPIDSLYEDIVMVLRDFRNMEDEVCNGCSLVLCFL